MTIRCDPDYEEQKELIDLEDRSRRNNLRVDCILDRSRRNNLRVDCILETSGETWEDYEQKLLQVFQEKLSLECPIEIERAHRTLSRQNNANNGNN